jgi:RNA polymerase primary sigma factor
VGRGNSFGAVSGNFSPKKGLYKFAKIRKDGNAIAEVHVTKVLKKANIRANQSLEKYLQEIGEVELLDPDEEVRLAKRIRRGDQRSLEKLCKANLRFVVSVAKQYQNQGLSLGDLINEGNLGLIKAAKRFDETRGYKFISYAVWWIRQSILQALAEQSRIVRLPLNRVGALNKIGKMYSSLEQEFEREPTPDEIAEVLEISPFEVTDTMRMSGRHLSMDAPFTQGEDNRLLDIIQNESQPPPDSGLMKESLRQEVDRALATLSTREAEVVRLYFGLNLEHPLTLEEIGERFRLTRERVRQIKEKALRRLRHTSRSKALRSYLG